MSMRLDREPPGIWRVSLTIEIALASLKIFTTRHAYFRARRPQCIRSNSEVNHSINRGACHPRLDVLTHALVCITVYDFDANYMYPCHSSGSSLTLGLSVGELRFHIEMGKIEAGKADLGHMRDCEIRVVFVAIGVAD